MTVVFDLDDTLFQEFEFCRSAYREIGEECARRFGADPDDIANGMYEAVTGGANPFDKLAKRLQPLASLSVDGSTIAGFDVMPWVERYRNHCPVSLDFLPGVEETLEELLRQGVRMAIVTDGRTGTQSAKIKALGLTRYVDDGDILISGSTGHDKHDPDNFLTLMSRHPEENEWVYVGDNPSKDFYHPNLLGWHTVCVRHVRQGVHRQDFNLSPDYLPDNVIDSMEGLLPLL